MPTTTIAELAAAAVATAKNGTLDYEGMSAHENARTSYTYTLTQWFEKHTFVYILHGVSLRVRLSCAFLNYIGILTIIRSHCQVIERRMTMGRVETGGVGGIFWFEIVSFSNGTNVLRSTGFMLWQWLKSAFHVTRQWNEAERFIYSPMNHRTFVMTTSGPYLSLYSSNKRKANTFLLFVGTDHSNMFSSCTATSSTVVLSEKQFLSTS